MLPLPALIELCRVLRHYMGAGLRLPEVFRQQAQRGHASMRPIAARIADSLEGGSSLPDALRPMAAQFPPLFVSLCNVADETGMLPEVFGELQRYFERQRKLRNEFYGRIAWPVFQFCAAVLVLTGLIWFMGQIPINTGPRGPQFDPLGLGLVGTRGAAIFFFGITGTIALGWLLVNMLRRTLAGRAGVDRWLLGVPALGPCLQALALTRFSLALRLTTESGISIGRALRLSMEATGNAAFAAGALIAIDSVKAGDDLTLALTRTNLFTTEFLHILEVAEESGSLSEVMQKQAEHYDDEASRRLAALTAVAGYAVWCVVAACIIFAIFRLYSTYISGIMNPKF